MFRLFATIALTQIFMVPVYAGTFTWDAEWYLNARGKEKGSDSIVDPTGRRINDPKEILESDLRINSKYTWQTGTKFVFRPRLLGDFNQFQYTDPSETKNTTTGQVTVPQAYLEGNPTRNTTIAIGLQNYQWGPAELLSPSNPFFHFRTDQRSYNYIENGRSLVRWNWNPNSRTTLIVIAEPVNNGQPSWIYDKDFHAKGVVKLERRGVNTLNYWGVDAGTMEDQIPFIGEYFNWEIFQGVSLYWDAKHSQGFAQYNPVLSDDGLYDLEYSRNTEDPYTLSIAGLRWEGSVDFRVEYIYNSYGLTKKLMTQALSSTLPQHPRGNVNLSRLMASGMEFLGQNYGYFSLRVPDFIIQNNNLFLRYILSLTDSSGMAQIAWDTAVGDAWTVYAEANASVGDKTQELSSLEKYSGTLGLKWSF